MVKNDNIFISLWKRLKSLLLSLQSKDRRNTRNTKDCINVISVDHLESYYKLDRIIGRGEFSKVRLAHCLTTGRKVAIKFISITPSTLTFTPSHSINNGNNIDNQINAIIGINGIINAKGGKSEFERVPLINREIEIIREIDHPNIIKLYKIFKIPDSLALVMQLAEGGELFEHVKSKRQLPEEKVKMFMKQICNAILYLHDRGIVHRDLKLENILLNRDRDQIFLSDFGFAAKLKLNNHNDNDKNREGGNEGDFLFLKTSCGSPCYAAPELVSSQNIKGYDGKLVDSWSLGIIMFAMLYGYLPFEQDESFLKAIRMNNVDMSDKWRASEIANLYRYILMTPVQFPFSLNSSHVDNGDDGNDGGGSNNIVSGNGHVDDGHVSDLARDLIRRFLDPNPKTRITVKQAQDHQWFNNTRITNK